MNKRYINEEMIADRSDWSSLMINPSPNYSRFLRIPSVLVEEY